MDYLNIKNDGSIILTEDKKFNSKDLTNIFLSEIINSNLQIEKFEKQEKSQYFLSIKIDNKVYSLNMFLKNITGAGWSNKPEMKRVQVSNLKNINPSVLKGNLNVLNVIIGIYNFDNNPIIVCWDGCRYLNHNTIRSCYVNIDTLKIGYEKGYYNGVCSSQLLWVFKGCNFSKFIIEFSSYINNIIKGDKYYE